MIRIRESYNQMSRYPNTIFWLSLIGLVIIAGSLRFGSLDWDNGFDYTPHPDERALIMKNDEISFPELSNISSLLNPEESTWNPNWFAYGSLPIYLLKISESLDSIIPNTIDHDIRILARTLSSLSDIGIIMGITLLSKTILNRKYALLIGVLVSFSVIHIQLSHYFAVDTLATFFCIWGIFFLCRVSSYGYKSDYIFSGIFIGLGISSKISVLPIYGALFTAHFLYILNQDIKQINIKNIILLPLSISVLVSVFTFLIAQPYSILDWNNFSSDITEQSEMVRRIRDYPYTRQYIDTFPYIYQFIQLGKWGIGWPLTILSAIGIFWFWNKGISSKKITIFLILSNIISIYLLITYNNVMSILLSMFLSLGSLWVSILFRSKLQAKYLVILSWVIPYLLITGSFEVKFTRYLLPIIPLLILLGIGFISDNIPKKVIGSSYFNFKNYKHISLIVLLSITTAITISYGLATQNIYSNPHTAVKASEWLNQHAPQNSTILKEHWEESLPLSNNFNTQELPIYDVDNLDKLTNLSIELEKGDYIVLFSNRLYGTVSRIPERYPYMTSYYHSLFNEELGYKLVKYESNYLKLGGIILFEDTFNRVNLPNPIDSESAGKINVGFADESFSVYDHPKVLIFKNVGKYSNRKINSIIEEKSSILSNKSKDVLDRMMINEDRLNDQRAGGTWTDIIKKDSWNNKNPILAWLFWIQLISVLAFPIGFLVFNKFKDKGYLLSKTLGILVSCYVTWILTSTGISTFSTMSVYIGIITLLFISAIILIHKKKEIIGFLKSTWKSIALYELLFLIIFLGFILIRAANPDLWHPFRGGEKPMDVAYLNAVVKSTFMPPYDPWFSGASLNYYYWGYFIVGSLIHLTGISTETAYNLAIPTFFALSVGGLFSIGYNLTNKINDNYSYKKIYPYLLGITTVIFVCILGNLDGLYQLINLLVKLESIGDFDFWRSSRMMPPDPPGFEITEFPFFTFLFADLHAHLMSIPLVILVAAIGLTIIKSSALQSYIVIEKIIVLMLIGITIGAISAINTWDIPVTTSITLGSVFVGYYLRYKTLNKSFFINGILTSCIVAGIAIITFIPYHTNTITFFNWIEPTTNVTTLTQILSINGFFLFLIATGIIVTLHNKFQVNKKEILVVIITSLIVSGAIAALNSYSGAILLSSTIGILIIFSSIKCIQNKEHLTYSLVYIYMITLIGLGIIFSIDIWRIEGDIERMNSVFKFYLQAWILLGIAASYFTYQIIISIPKMNITSKYVVITIITFLLISSSIYPFLGTKDRIADRFNTEIPLTLDGYAYTKNTFYFDELGAISLESDIEAIKWIRENIDGSPVILEGITPSYRWGGRVSINTGLPAPIGWAWHQEQQRWGAKDYVQERRNDVDKIYTYPDESSQLLNKYQIEYIYIGDLERIYYPKSSIAKIENGLSGKLTKIFTSDKVSILKVNK